MSIEILKPKDFEAPKKLELEITEPHDDKNFMICFESDDEEVCRVYNNAIASILQNHELKPFHQIGRHGETGYHGWEIWQKSDKETLQNLLSEIQGEVEKTING